MVSPLPPKTLSWVSVPGRYTVLLDDGNVKASPLQADSIALLSEARELEQEVVHNESKSSAVNNAGMAIPLMASS